MKKKLIGLGKNKHTGGGKGHTRPKMTKGKAAPPDFAVLEEEESKKKATIKIKVIKNEENLDEKKKKRRKKRKKKKNLEAQLISEIMKNCRKTTMTDWHYEGKTGLFVSAWDPAIAMAEKPLFGWVSPFSI